MFVDIGKKLTNSANQSGYISSDGNNDGLDNAKFVDTVDFSAEAFVERLLTEGTKTVCDETSNSFNKEMKLPPYFDRDLYKRGQNFFFKHIWGLFLSKLLGLIILLKMPAIKILMMTNMSDTPLKAYRRYLATIFHMCIWYYEDLVPGSKLWDSMGKVKAMHNSASKKSKSALNTRITQKDMAMTQFGFMGFALTRNKMMGIHHATEEEWKAFIHVWRVVGYLLGIEDKYNICRESVAETRAICELLIDRVFLETMQTHDKDFVLMSRALVEGMWVMNPVLQWDAFIYYMDMALENSKDKNKPRGGIVVKEGDRFRLNMIIWAVWLTQYTVFRLLLKYIHMGALWLMKVCPFLAYYKFGKANSHVVVDGY